MPLIKVLLPGLWWHDLTYQSPELVEAGRRVRVPVGTGSHVGLSRGEEDGSLANSGYTVRAVESVLDESPVLPASYMRAARVTANAFLCSTAEVLRSLLPSGFWRGETFPAYAFADSSRESRNRFIYRFDDGTRFQMYRDVITERERAALVLFQERACAKRFYASLVGIVPKERLFLWPASGAKSAAAMWKKIMEADCPVVVGGPGAAAAPLDGSGTIIVDEESGPAWRTVRYPVFSVRSFVAARARASGAELILGGRLPSSRVYSGFSPEEIKMPRERRADLRLIDINSVPRVNFRGIEFPLPVADAVIELTVRQTSEGQIVFWLLDRRGVSSELHCADCGQVFSCPRCGAAMTLEDRRFRCSVCGFRGEVPGACPVCGGRLLQGSSAGLELLAPLAQNLLGNRPVVLWHADNPATATEGKSRTALLKASGGLLLGSRRALCLLDELSPSTVVWLDADSEARQPRYDSRFNAYAMLLESCWRGASRREVVLQVRSGLKPWIRGLSVGWGYFWQKELVERKNLGFPPYSHLVRIEMPPSCGGGTVFSEMERAGFFVMRPDSESSKAAVLTSRVPTLRRFLEKYFTIRQARGGFPRLEVWSD